MYNLNLLPPVRTDRVGGFDYPSTSSGQAKRIHSELLPSVPNQIKRKFIRN